MAYFTLMAAILAVTLPLLNYCAPVQEDISFLDEDPTLDPLAVPSYPKNTSRNEFIRNLNRCLKLRDESRDLRAQGCIPDVFSTDSDVPLAAHSNTVLSFLSVNSSVVDNQLHFIINNLQDLSAGIIHTNAVHLRIYKSDISDDKLLSTMLREGGLKLFVTVSNDSLLTPMVTSTAQFPLQELTISRADLINEGWLDFHLDKVQFLHVYSKFTNAHKLHLQVTIVPDSGSISVFKDIGINNIIIGDEPVLIIYGKEKLQFISQKFLNNPPTTSIKAKRDIIPPEGGSGVLTDSEVCRLVEYQLPYSRFGLHDADTGFFNVNYCSGHCRYPLPHKKGNVIFYHPILLSIFQSRDKTVETAAISPPCCVPVEYMSLTYIEQESEWNTVTRTFPDITATGCSCR